MHKQSILAVNARRYYAICLNIGGNRIKLTYLFKFLKGFCIKMKENKLNIS